MMQLTSGLSAATGKRAGAVGVSAVPAPAPGTRKIGHRWHYGQAEIFRISCDPLYLDFRKLLVEKTGKICCGR
jgi:hypothetical protein